MTVKQVAERLEVSPSLIYLIIAEGKLRCTRHGMGRGTLRINEEQLAEYLRLIDEPIKPLRFIK